ncbi:MAG TPA: methionine--tRNA ligase [Limnochordia bacterium]|nr:methionine--tRNA ligase [Limnochordia bacterium]
MKILIGSAWPYANGPLHIGHVAALLPADVIARYFRAKGENVYFVSGSDCHGTPVAIRAKEEDTSPEEISELYHEEFCECFARLGFSYDRYGKTSSEEHRLFVSEFHRHMYARDHIYEQDAPQAYCSRCNRVLADRFVVGSCPACTAETRGDQCDACGTVVELEQLGKPTCASCQGIVTFRKTKHLFLAISRFEKELRTYLQAHPTWRKNAVAFTKRYIEEGLRDRAITRDLDWGIDVPKDGYEDKKIYIWAENVLGYLSMSKEVADSRGEDYAALWGADSRHYYVHGKDNIPFHTIILPALLLAHGGKWRLPDEIISSEYLTLEGRRISTSQNWAIWVRDIIERYQPDSIRYFLLTNGPEKRDSDFSWREFVNSHNSELLGAYGNFVNRTLAFIHRYFNGLVPEGILDQVMEKKISDLYADNGCLIESGKLKEALDNTFGFVRLSNKYFDSEKPWETRQTNLKACGQTLYTCVQIIANLAVLLEPFLPFSSGRIREWLRLDSKWAPKGVPAGYKIPEPEILFERLEKATVEAELARIGTRA